MRDDYANIKRIDVTLIDHHNGEVDEAVAERNEQIVDSMGTAFPFICY